MAYDFKIMNTSLTKNKKHPITYNSGSLRSQISFFFSFFFVRSIDKRVYKDCNVISRKSLTIQHRILILDVHFKGNKQKNNRGDTWKSQGNPNLHLVQDV